MARLNENENENEDSGGGRGGLFAGSRYNTYKVLKQAFNPNGVVIADPTVPFRGYDAMGGWDAENKGWVYITDFIGLKGTWFNDLRNLAAATWHGWDLSTPTGQAQLASALLSSDFRNLAASTWNGADLSIPAGKAKLESALRDIVDAAGEREDRFAEVLHQRDAEGCITYWMGMLNIQPGKHPNTYLLIRVARKLGEMIVMCLKAHFNVPRPSQLCPALVPMFDPPQTAAYPAGHALQSYLISYFLRRVMPNMPQSSKPPIWGGTLPHEGLFALARRVADNRVIGGVHYDIDNEAGFLIAKRIDEWFDEWVAATDPGLASTSPPSAQSAPLISLLRAAKGEFPQFN